MQIESHKIGKSFDETKENAFIDIIATANPKLRAYFNEKTSSSIVFSKIVNLTSFGSDSTMHKYVNEQMPTELMNTTKPRLTTGIQSMEAKS